MAQSDRTTGLVGNAAFKVPVRAATTAKITLNGLQTVDGVSLVAGDRVLVKDQDDTTQNGIWVVDTGDWYRAKDADGPHDWVQGSFIYVIEGTTYENTYWRLTTANPVRIGSSSLTFVNALISDASAIIFKPSGTGATERTVEEKLREIVTLTDFEGADPTGATESTAAFQAAMVKLANGGKLILPPGEWLLNPDSDDDVILVPSDVEIEWQAGAVVKFGGDERPYRPAFMAISKNRPVFTNPRFVYTGNFVNSGSQTNETVNGVTVRWYSFSAAIFIYGCTSPVVRGFRGEGESTSNVINAWIFEANNTSAVYDDIEGNDCASVLSTGDGEDNEATNVRADRMNSDEAVLAYGQGHVIYCFWNSGKIEGVYDAGTDTGADNTGHSIAFKANKDLLVRDINSRRLAGPFTLSTLSSGDTARIDVKGVHWYLDSGVPSSPPFYIPSGIGGNVKQGKVEDVYLHCGSGSYTAFSVKTDDCIFSNINVFKDNNDASNAAILEINGVGNKARIRVHNTGSANGTLLVAGNTSNTTENDIEITTTGATIVEKLTFGGTGTTAQRNRIVLRNGYGNKLANGLNRSNLSFLQAAEQYDSMLLTPLPSNHSYKTFSAGTSLSDTIYLPREGSYLVQIALVTDDRNHAKIANYIITTDNVSSFDFTSVRLLPTSLIGTATYDPGSIADGAGETTTLAVPGAAMGDPVQVSFSNDLQGITLTGYVSAADTVSVRFQNESGGELDLTSGTITAAVTKLYLTKGSVTFSGPTVTVDNMGKVDITSTLSSSTTYRVLVAWTQLNRWR